MNKYLNDFPKHEQRFLRKFFDFVNSFNKFDSNLTAFLGWFVSGGAPDMAYPVIEKLTIHEKIDSLKDIVNNGRLKTNKELINDFNEWCTEALKLKSLRNNFVHAQWQILVRNDTYKFFHYYNLQSIGKSKDGFLSIDEFEEIVATMENLGAKFDKIRKKHLAPYMGGRIMPSKATLT